MRKQDKRQIWQKRKAEKKDMTRNYIIKQKDKETRKKETKDMTRIRKNKEEQEIDKET